MTIKPHSSLEYVNGDFVFRLQAKPDNGFDSYVSIYSKRHYDNCLANKTMPWAMTEIKVKANNGEFIVNPEIESFNDFCEDWITNPHAAKVWAKQQIENIERIRELRYADSDSEDWDRKTDSHIKQLHDFPYVVYKPYDNE